MSTIFFNILNGNFQMSTREPYLKKKNFWSHVLNKTLSALQNPSAHQILKHSATSDHSVFQLVRRPNVCQWETQNEVAEDVIGNLF